MARVSDADPLPRDVAHTPPRGVWARAAPTWLAAGRWAVVVAVGAACGQGCGASGSDTASTVAARPVDTAQVEQGIKESLSTPQVKVSSATCPDDVQVEKGATFTCTVKLGNGATGKATVTQDGGNRYTYALTPGSVQIPGATADAAVEKSLAAQGAPDAVVNCPSNIIVKVGTTVTCNVSGAQGAASGTVTYTFSEDNGTVDPNSVKTA